MAIFQLPTGSSEQDVPEGEILAGKYRAERVLGAGGMGVVVRVVPVEGEGVFALKFLRPSVARDEVAAKRFLREAEASRRIESPHVVKIPDVGELASGTPYLVMEYLEGSTLEALLAAGKRLPVERACDLALQAAEGLAAAHAMGVIHRDIKPANLYLTAGAGGSEVLKIVDFGVSKILDPEGPEGQNLTRTQTSIGSPLYMSPEQMRSARTADFRADQWSLGAVLYRMVTGHLPFDAKSLPRVCVQVLTGDFAPIATHRPDLPAELAAAIERCLRVEPRERYADIADLAEAIAPFAGPSGHARAERCRAILREAKSGVPTPALAEPTS
ncbi:MAG: serine/threonine protein kinase [Deltaproteobacteria bacterium]|nr:serine/threonine protein kinase [Deltaproteobacteria bacterium]